MMKKTLGQILKSTLAMFLMFLTLVPQAVLAQQQRAELSLDERRRASPTVQMRLLKMRQLIINRRVNYRVGLTPVSERDLQSITGEILPDDLLKIASKQNTLVAAKFNTTLEMLSKIDFSKNMVTADVSVFTPQTPILEIDKFGNKTDKSRKKEYQVGKSEDDKQKTGEYKPPCLTNASVWDARTFFKIPPVRDQGKCGSCWVFSAQSLFEIVNWQTIVSGGQDTSEQYTLDVSGGGDYKGGYSYKALNYLTSFGALSEFKVPYKAEKGTSDPNIIKSGSDNISNGAKV